jgi:hypothetical protein
MSALTRGILTHRGDKKILSEISGKVLLFWYPCADTPG